MILPSENSYLCEMTKKEKKTKTTNKQTNENIEQ